MGTKRDNDIDQAILSDIMSRLGKKGGKIGGKKAAANMTPAERSERARKASLVAVANRKKKAKSKSRA
jgi:hypothetical protein